MRASPAAPGSSASNLADRLRADGVEVSIVDDFRTGRREFLAELTRGSRSEPLRGRRARRGAARARVRGLRLGVPSAGQRRRATRARASPAATWSRTRSPPRPCSRRCEPSGVSKIAFSSTGSVYGEPERLPDAGGCAVPDPDLAVWRLQAGRRGDDRRLRARLRVHRAGRSASSRSSASATRTVTCSTSTARSSATRRGCGCSATAARRSHISTSRTASTAILTAVEAHDQRPARPRIYNLGTDETVVVDDSIAIDLRAPRRSTRASSTPAGRRGWAGDSPLIHLDCSRIRVARLGADARHPRGDRRTLEWFDANPYVRGGAASPEAGVAMSVIFSRAPLRISLGGGGTDLPSYYREHGGFLVAGAIDKYIYMLMHTVFQRRYRMKYSETEDVEAIGEIRHPILRETLRATGAATRWRSPRSPTCPPGPGWAPRARSPSRCSRGSRTPADLGHPGRARRGRVRDRDRCARGAMRQAGPLRRRARRHLRIHVQPRRHASSVEPLELAAQTLRGLREQPAAVLHRRGARRVGGARPIRTSAPRPATPRCSRTCTGPRRSGGAAASCCSTETCSPTPS